MSYDKIFNDGIFDKIYDNAKKNLSKKLVVCKVGLRSRCLRDNVMTGSARDETGDRSVSLSLYLRSRS